MAYFFLFILGLCVGSFLNVVVYRLNLTSLNFHLQGEIPRTTKGSGHGCRHLGGVMGVLGGRSFCPKCKHRLAWFDNLPLLSFVWLKGKCRYCREPISWQYPLVELATGILTVLVVFHLFPPSEESLRATSEVSLGLANLGGVFSLLVTCYLLLVTYSLITIFVSDWLYETIPDEVTFPGMAIAVVYQVALFFLFTSEVKSADTSEVDATRLLSIPESQNPLILFRQIFVSHFGSFFLAGLGAAGFFLLLALITRGKGMGMGDVKLAGLMGLILGFPKIIVALMLAFLTGAIAGVILILLGKKGFGEHIPFGPFLAGATWLSFFWGEKIISFYFSLF